MYRRYSQVGDGGMPLSQVNRNRVKNIIIFLLLIAIGALLFISLPLIQGKESNHSLYIQQMQRECQDAYSDASTLSRTAGADTAATLAKIRCNVYAIRSMNNMSAATGNGQFIGDERLLTLQNTIDRYLQYLTTGMDTGEYTTSLQTALMELQGILGSLN